MKGEPCSIAASPPISTYCTWKFWRVRRITSGRNCLGSSDTRVYPARVAHILREPDHIQELVEALLRSERQVPQRQHQVVVIVRHE